MVSKNDRTKLASNHHAQITVAAHSGRPRWAPTEGIRANISTRADSQSYWMNSCSWQARVLLRALY